MPGARLSRIDWVAWSVFGIGFLVTLCVLTLEPARDSAGPGNILGAPGAWLAESLLFTLGSAVYPFLACWFVSVVLLLRGDALRVWLPRLLGWTSLVPLSALLLDLWNAPWLPGSLAGKGGALGAWLTATCLQVLPAAVIWCLLVPLFGVSLYLAVPEVMRVLLRHTWNLLRLLAALPPRAISWMRRRRTQAPVPAESEPTPPPRTRKKTSEKKTEPESDIPIIRADQPSILLPVAAEQADDPAAMDEPVSMDEPAPTILPIVRGAPTAAEEERRFEDYELPPLTLLQDPAPFPFQEHDQALRDRAALLEKTFKDFDLNVRVVGINTGPVITQYEIALETGLRVNKITVMSDDLALNLKVPSVRIVAPIPGKNTVGIEVPNEHRATVHLKETIINSGFKPGTLGKGAAARAKIPLFLGKDTEGRPLVYDLAEMPHLLIAGRTGTGKSVCMNAIILSMLMTRRPDEVRMVMIDPKMLEMSEYGKIPHLMHPVVKDMKKAEAILAWAVDKMEERYDLLSRARVRGIAGYNELGLEEIIRRVKPDEDEAKRISGKMPYIVIFVDEMNDLMMTMKREVEAHIIRLAQKSRAAGIHLVVATQKPTVDVITGLIKSNLPARICFQVSSRSDSRVVLDEMGAEKLLGKGDMLFLQPGTSTILRAQGTYAADSEIEQVVAHLECDEPNYAEELIQLKTSSDPGGATGLEKLRARDDLYEQAIEIVVREGRGSVSLLQRALGIGYGRAARLIDFMAEDGIVGTYNGSNAREVLFTPEDWAAMKEGATAAAT